MSKHYNPTAGFELHKIAMRLDEGRQLPENLKTVKRLAREQKKEINRLINALAQGQSTIEETVSTVNPGLDKASVTQEQVATFYYLVNDMYKEGKIDIDDLERHFDRLVEFARHTNERFHQAPSSKELGLEESGLVKTF